MSPSRTFWANLAQHTIRMTATTMVSSIVVSSAGTAGGYLPVTQVNWVGGALIGLTALVITVLIGFTSIVIPGADPDSISFLPAAKPAPPNPAPPPTVVPPPAAPPAAPWPLP